MLLHGRRLWTASDASGRGGGLFACRGIGDDIPGRLHNKRKSKSSIRLMDDVIFVRSIF